MADHPDIQTVATQLIVYRGGLGDPLCTVQAHSDCTIRLAGDEAGCREVFAVLQSKYPIGDSGGQTVENSNPRSASFSIMSRCRMVLESAGYATEEAPAGDLQLTFSLDAATGNVLGQSKALHPFAEATGKTAERLFAAISALPVKMANEHADRLEEALARGDHFSAARALVDGAQLGNSERLLSVARAVDVSELPEQLAREVLWVRLALGERFRDRGNATAADAKRMRDMFWDALSLRERAKLLLVEGTLAATAGRREQAFATWRSVLDLEGVEDSDRAWANWNCSLLLGRTDPAAALFAQGAADAYLQAGERRDAARAVHRYALCILASRPAEAVAALDEALAWFKDTDANSRDTRAGLLHARADALLSLGRVEDAEQTALRAANERNGLYGVEDRRASSLHLAGIAARADGRDEDAAHYDVAADDVSASCADPTWALQSSIGKLFLRYDATAASRLRAEADRQADRRAQAMLLVADALFSKAEHIERLALLEEAEGLLSAARPSSDDTDLVKFAIAQELLGAGSHERALPYYKDLLAHDPLHSTARQNYPALLWKLHRWEEAVAFFGDQLKLFGPLPGLLYGYGRSLLESGEPSRAAEFLHRARTSASRDAALRERADRLLDLAFERGARPAPQQNAETATPLTRQDLEDGLRHFAAFISANKRMAFWQPGGNRTHKWRAKPERQAQDLSHAFLKGTFGERIEVLEEVASGAGRIDIYVRCHGGLAAILELKMLGCTYSSTYAFQGAEQITHYMVNKGVHLGFLVIFDARVRENGLGIGPSVAVGRHTVNVVFADVRPSVKASS